MGQSVRLSIERMADTGEGIGQWPDGRVCFVPGALPGEVVDVALQQERKRWVRAKLLQVVKTAPERIEADCPVFGRCGGCDWRMIDSVSQCALRRTLLQQRLEHHGFDIEVGTLTPSDGRRSRVQVRHRKATWGFVERRSRELAAVQRCPATDPLLVEAIARFSAGMPNFRGRIHWRRDERGAVSVHTGPVDDPPGVIQGLRVAGVVGGAVGRRRFGDPTFCFSVDGLEMDAPPEAFTQVNLAANRELIHIVNDTVGEAEQVLDLYCGIGNFSLPLAARGKRVVGAEGAPASVRAAERNARRNGLDRRTRFIRADLERPQEVVTLIERTDATTVILDPPRTGARIVSQVLVGSATERVVMVSCDPATAMRDLVMLRDGGFSLQRVSPVDMFPGTAHVEAVYLLER